jgi:hypothetical protein
MKNSFYDSFKAEPFVVVFLLEGFCGRWILRISKKTDISRLKIVVVTG